MLATTTMATSVSLFVSLNEKKRRAGFDLGGQDKQSWRRLKCKLERMLCGKEHSPESDLRESLRVPVKLNVQIEHQGVYSSGSICEISDGGCFIRTTVPTVRGRLVKMTIVSSAMSKCRVQGEVVRISRSGTTQHGLGIRFHFASDEQQNELHRLVDSCLFHANFYHQDG